MLIYDQRSDLASVGYEENEVLGLFDEMHSEARGLSVRKEQGQKLQDEITDNYERFREAIERAYDAAERG